nr:fumarylacetoacetate hydrolase family protein [Pseudomonas sp.]
MKLVSYQAAERQSWGVLLDSGIVEGQEILSGKYRSVREVLQAGAIADVGNACRGMRPKYHLQDVQLLPPIPDPEKVLCIGLNYGAHAAEAGRQLPKEPSCFVRLANTLLAHDAEIIAPKVSECLDFEGELAVIIGRAGRHILPENALEYVGGYSCFNDVSVRDYQKHSVTAGKNFIGTAPFGPWIVTADEIADPAGLTLRTRLNGREVQCASTGTMIYGIPQIIAYLSTITPLAPGDIIATGTPAGVGLGRTPPLWMQEGDLVQVDISGIGVLSNRVRKE